MSYCNFCRKEFNYREDRDAHKKHCELREECPPYSVVFSREECLILGVLFEKHMTRRDYRGEAWKKWDEIIKNMDEKISEAEVQYVEDLERWS